MNPLVADLEQSGRQSNAHRNYKDASARWEVSLKECTAHLLSPWIPSRLGLLTVRHTHSIRTASPGCCSRTYPHTRYPKAQLNFHKVNYIVALKRPRAKLKFGPSLCSNQRSKGKINGLLIFVDFRNNTGRHLNLWT